MGDFDANVRLLRRVQILSGLEDSDFALLEPQLTWLRVMTGQQVVSHLERTTSVFFVLEGEIRIRIGAGNGKEVAFRRIGPGGHFGEISALTGAPRTAAASVETPGLIAELTAPNFRALLEQSPGVALRLLEALARNVTYLTDRVFELSTLDIRMRLCVELLRRARERPVAEDGSILIDDAPTHEEFGALIGAQREAVTRELRALSQAGIVRYKRGEVTIVDPEKLRTLVETEGGIVATHLVDWSL